MIATKVLALGSYFLYASVALAILSFALQVAGVGEPLRTIIEIAWTVSMIMSIITMLFGRFRMDKSK